MGRTFGDKARRVARTLSYTELDAEEMTKRKVKQAGENIESNLSEPRLDELCSELGLDTEGLDNPATEFTPQDLALAGWSNWGAGSFHRAFPRSSLTEGEFIVLNDYFEEIVNLD